MAVYSRGLPYRTGKEFSPNIARRRNRHNIEEEADDDDDEDEGGEDYFYFPLDHFNKTWWIEKQDALAELRKRTEGERE